VTFRSTNNSVITTTGVLPAGGAIQFFADVAIPAGFTPGTNQIYFRALSPSSALSDRLHDAVIVSPIRSLSLAPNNNGQVFPGGTITYSHLLVNNGNVIEATASAAASRSPSRISRRAGARWCITTRTTAA
jgi:hypothetical protein